ncbi:ATP-binding protein [Fundidesulfovibrio putealis]|uniref:ATP-binding protein n=1 Tax=Fundidesulfovibrio putealis TaxID=270496 RepID=UPI00041C37EE|nr:ATP-binding protein [Fundidesulfovibrio putealis]
MAVSQIPFFRGLAFRLAAWVLVFSLAVSLAMSSLLLYAKHRDFLADKERQLKGIGEVNLPSLANALWNLDQRSLLLQLEGLRQMPDVELVEVGDGVSMAGSLGETSSTRRLERIYSLHYELRGEARQLGTLRVVLGLDKGLDRLWRDALLSIALETARTLAMGGALLFIFYSLVGRHLRRMASYAAGLTVTGLEKPLVLDRRPSATGRPDEMDQLSGALETMRINLLGSVEELKTANESLIEEIDRREEAEKQVRATRAALRNIIDSMPSAVIGLSGDMVVTHFNAMAAQMSGMNAEQAVGRTLGEVFAPLVAHQDMVREALEERKPVARQRLTLQVLGGEITADLVVYPLLAEQGGGVVIRVDDETQRAQLEEVLIQTEKMVSLGSLAAGMAHEINNPLAGVLQSAQSMQRRLSSGLRANDKAAREAGIDLMALEAYLKARDIPEILVGMRSAGERAARIVANMLKFSRLSKRTHEGQNLAEVVDAALELAESDYDLNRKYDFRRMRITRLYDPSLPPVPCSAQEMEQVVLNIVKNAAQAMGNIQGPALTVSLRREDLHAVIEISDNGPGMDESVRKRVFDPFFTTKMQGEGTGLGLSVSYFIITQNHRGAIQVESAPGEGTTFTIRLPLEGQPA